MLPLNLSAVGVCLCVFFSKRTQGKEDHGRLQVAICYRLGSWPSAKTPENGSIFQPCQACGHSYKGQEKHLQFFNINFLPPPKTPPEKNLCASFPIKEHNKGTHINFFWGILGSNRGSQMGHFWPQKVSLLFFFPALKCPFSLPISCGFPFCNSNGHFHLKRCPHNIIVR